MGFIGDPEGLPGAKIVKVGGHGVLDPTYHGVKTGEKVKELEERVRTLENHLYLPQKMDVKVYAEKNYVVVEAKNWDNTLFQSQGVNGTKRSMVTRPYVADYKMRIALSLNEHHYDLRSTDSVHPISNPFA